MNFEKKMNVKASADICVIGGSCTGVFAAIRTARLGKKVILVEQSGKFGGVVTLDFVIVLDMDNITFFPRLRIGLPVYEKAA